MSKSENMDWACPEAEPVVTEAAQKVSERKDETRAAKRVRRREQQKVAQQRYRCASKHVFRLACLCTETSRGRGGGALMLTSR